MKIAFLMDPLGQLKPQKDTTLAMIQEAHARGWSCYFFTPLDLVCREGKAYANLSTIRIKDLKKSSWAKTEPQGEVCLSELDLILMRKDPPFDLEYIYLTYFLELAERDGVLVVNKPQSLRAATEKFFTLRFPACCPATLVSKNFHRLHEFWQQHRCIILKPMNAMGGRGVFYIGEDGLNLPVIIELLTQDGRETIMAQQYIPAIKKTGDKRILLIDGKPVPYALARIPAPGDIRGNLVAGAEGKVVELSMRDYFICEQLAPTLQQMGLHFVGIDVIGDYLTEINVTSPTCAVEIHKGSGYDVMGEFFTHLENLVSSYSST